ncbi:RNase A-like domain-containing protein [Nocardioides sp. SYSU D00065]|uniref:RNase A-like domain-containing protein n=1 Tax=Nocardioides sp. SYSU D00065 TaxID=2817378 RepID=UPI001B33EBEE|nr:RNase A-like domain-containing protein [Nocardioides sp. SYSU D00065]
MRISVECGGFTEAADACRTANHISAVLTESLAGRLARCAGMAGDDATSSAFATAYDVAARQAFGALIDLTNAFTGMGRLLTATADSHSRAEAAAAGDAMKVLGYDGGSLDDGAFVRVQPRVLVSCRGAQEPSLGSVDAWILDRVEGFVWPGADVEQLRTAASAWRRAAASVAGLADHVDVAVALVRMQRSPEIPLAADALSDLATLVGDTGWQLSHLATACDEYADAVEDARDRTRALLAEVAQMIVEGAAISVLATGVTGGFGGGAAVAAAAARVRSNAPRFHALLDTLRAGVATATTRLQGAWDELDGVRRGLEKFARVPARTELGTLRHPGGWLPPRRGPGWLRQHEVPPGHTLERHVGKTEQELLERCRTDGLKRASTFTDEAEAERLIDAVLARKTDVIERWLRTGSDEKLLLDAAFEHHTGMTTDVHGTSTATRGVRVVLIPSKTQPGGWQVLTAFPR